MAKAHKTDSTAGALQAHRDAKGYGVFDWDKSNVDRIEDDEAAEKAQAFADGIWAHRVAYDWGPNDRALIAELSNCQAELNRLNKELRASNYLLEKEGSKGQPILTRHPLMDAQTYLAGRVTAITKMLNVAKAPSDSRSIENRRKVASDAAGDRTVQPIKRTKKGADDFNNWDNLQ